MTPQEEIQTILKKHNAKLGYEITFPIYRELPDEVKLALKVLGRHGMKISITIKQDLPSDRNKQ